MVVAVIMNWVRVDGRDEVIKAMPEIPWRESCLARGARNASQRPVNEFWHGTRCTVGKPGRPHWVASRDTAAR